MKLKWVIPLLLFPTMSSADSLNLSMPQSPSEYGSDRFRAGDLDCSNSINGATKLEFGMTGIVGESNDSRSTLGSQSFGGDDVSNYGVYGRIVIPLGGPRERVNCNTLYQLELEKKRLEVQALKLQIENLENGVDSLEFFE